MSRKKSAIQVQKEDWIRVLLSETTPAEIPVLISNDGFYLNIKKSSFPKSLSPLIDEFVKSSSDKRFSIPFSYKITKDAQSLRRLGLPHPRAQLEIVAFYKRYHQLITHYCGRGNFSARRPDKLASYYYSEGKNQEAFAYKSHTVSTADTDKITRHSVSIFSYSGFPRLHKFFSSPIFSNLERKYKCMASLDVSKCFDSIYTHSVAWAVRSKYESKRSTKAETFGGSFDRLMQLMNYNETNGIIIGPEVSRIFAEIIFDRIDSEVETRLDKKNYSLGVDYSVYRYVDNYYVFYNSDRVFRDVKNEIVDALDFYKLSLNSAKSEHAKRPFFTFKSMAISEAEAIREQFFDAPIQEIFVNKLRTNYIDSKQLSKLNLSKYSTSLRRACHVAQSDYESVVAFLIASLRVRVQRVVSSQGRYESYLRRSLPPQEDSIKDYQNILAKYLARSIDLCMHTYTLSPSVPASLDVAIILILSADTLQKFDVDHMLHVRERLQMWMSRLMTSSGIRTLIENEHAVPIEVLNILCALKSYGFDGQHLEEVVSRTIGFESMTTYFEIVSTLYALSDLPMSSPSLNSVFLAAKKKILSDIDLGVSSESIHLLLDILSCPYIDRKERKKLYRSVVADYNEAVKRPDVPGRSLPSKATNADIDEMLEHMEGNPWFVNWREVDLVRLIEKKKLRNGYT